MLDGERRVLQSKQCSIPILRESQGSHGVHQSGIEHLTEIAQLQMSDVHNSASLISWPILMPFFN